MSHSNIGASQRRRQTLENLASWHTKPQAAIRRPATGRGLSGHRAYLRELRRLHAAQQSGRLGGVHLKERLEHIQGAIPEVLVAAIEHKLELRHVERQVDLRNAAIGAEHLPQPGPGTFHGVTVDFAPPVPIQVERILARTVIDRLMAIAVLGEEMIDAIAVRIDSRATLHHLLHDGANGLRLHIAQHEQPHCTAATHQTEDGQPITLPGAASPPFESPLARRAFQFQPPRRHPSSPP